MSPGRRRAPYMKPPCFEEMGTPAHTYAPAFRRKSSGTILRYSSHITFNSLEQYRKFAPALHREGKHISPGLRINPEYSEISWYIQSLLTRIPPGVTAAELANGLPEGWRDSIFMSCLNLIHIRSEKVPAVVEEKFGHLLPKLKWLNMGGGHLMTRRLQYRPSHWPP